VIDSSKDSRHGFVLTTVPGVRLRVLHMVRDSRAVAFSWQRARPRPEVHWTSAEMPRYTALYVARMWIVGNLLAVLLRRRSRGQLVRYEDLVTDPACLEDLTRADNTPTEFVHQPVERLLHSVSGNPLRFDERGSRPMRLDDAWRQGLRRRDYLLVTAATAPLLKLYGYALRRSTRG